MQRIRAILEKKRRRRHVGEVDQMVSRAQEPRRRVSVFRIRKKISQTQSEVFGWHWCYVIFYVWKLARGHFLAEMGEVRGEAGTWILMEKGEDMTSSRCME